MMDGHILIVVPNWVAWAVIAMSGISIAVTIAEIVVGKKSRRG
jgi:hypothetical protein